MPTDRQLVARLRVGEVDAFDAAYEAYRARIYSFLARLTRDPALAEDLLQEAFLRLAHHAGELRADTNLGAWLFRVARNLFISHKRWAMLDVGRLSELRLLSQLRGPPPSPFAMAAANETERSLEQALARLPLPYREVLLLVAVEGMTPSEVAPILGIDSAAVRKRLERARAMMRAHLP